MLLAVFIALCNAIMLVELVIRVMRGARFKQQITLIHIGFAKFQSAVTDDERQRSLLAAGAKIVLLSTLFLGFCVFLSIVTFAPLWLFDWDKTNEEIYLASLTILSMFWFWGRTRYFPRNFQI